MIKIYLRLCMVLMLLPLSESFGQLKPGYFIFYFNYPVDSVYINENPVSLKYGNLYAYPGKGIYKIRTALRDCESVTSGTEVKSLHRLYPIRSYFHLLPDAKERDLSHLPLKSFAGALSIVPKGNLIIANSPQVF